MDEPHELREYWIIGNAVRIPRDLDSGTTDDDRPRVQNVARERSATGPLPRDGPLVVLAHELTASLVGAIAGHSELDQTGSVQSARNAAFGSARVARAAGMALAISATSRTMPATALYVRGSVADC